MNILSLLLFLHILGAVVWIGGGATVALIGLRVRRSSERVLLSDFARTIGDLGLRAFMPALFVVLVTGLLMVVGSTRWRMSQPWLIIGSALFLVAFLIGAVYQSRIAIALQRTVSAPGADLSGASALIGRWLIGYGAILLVLVVAVWDMVFKPFLSR